MVSETPSAADIVVGPISGDEIRTAYPLILHVAPGVALDTWLRFAQRYVPPRPGRREGVLVARRLVRPYPCGLVLWQYETSLSGGPVLLAHEFVALDTIDPAPVLGALAAALDRLAGEMGCAAVRSHVHDNSGEVQSELMAAGHKLEGSVLWKRLGTAPPPARVTTVRPSQPVSPGSRPRRGGGGEAQ